MKIREYLRFIWKEEFTQNQKIEEKIINTLSRSLKEELFLEAHGSLLNKYPMFFANFSENTLRRLMYKMNEIRVTPEDLIFTETFKDDGEIYFLVKGKVQIFVNENLELVNPSKSKEKTTILHELNEEGCFGEISFFSGIPRCASAKSKDYSTLFFIKRSDFLDILNESPDDYEKYCMIRDQIILQKNHNSLGIKCFACKQSDHITLNCPFLHFIPDKDRVIKIHTFNPEHKERHPFHRNSQRSHDAIGLRKPIKLSCIKFRENLRKTNAIQFWRNEDGESEFDSLGTLEDPTEKELMDVEKYRSILNSKEEKREIQPGHSKILFSPANEFLTLPKIKEGVINEVNEEIDLVQNTDVEKPLLLSHRAMENQDPPQNEREEQKSPHIFKIPSNLSIDTSNSKSKEIMLRVKNKSLPSRKEEDNFSMKSKKSNTSHEKKEISVEKESRQEGSMLFNFEGVDLELFKTKKPIKKSSMHSFGSLICDKINYQGKNKRIFDLSDQRPIRSRLDNLKNNALKLGKQRSMMEPKNFNDNNDGLPNRFRTSSKDYPILKKTKTSNDQTIIKSPQKNSDNWKKNSSQRRPKPSKSALLKKWHDGDGDSEAFRSPLLRVTGGVDSRDSSLNDENGQESQNPRQNDADDRRIAGENWEADFERVRNFKNYFPMNNVREVILKIIKYRRSQMLKRSDKKRRKTKKFTEFYANQKNIMRKSYDSNKIVPLAEAGVHEMISSSRLASPKMQDRRASNIFIERLNTVNFFKKATVKYSFYDIVFEVLSNKDLRKTLYAMREKSQKNKLKTRFTFMS